MLGLTLTGNFTLTTQHSFQDTDSPENILCPVDGNLLLAIMTMELRTSSEIVKKPNIKHGHSTRLIQANITVKKPHLMIMTSVKNPLNTTTIQNSTEKKVHKQFPALYPDDIENISNMSEEQSYLCCQIQATLLQRMRSSTPIDTSCWCTCPKKESQKLKLHF